MTKKERRYRSIDHKRFKDEVVFTVKSGDGGDGAVHFRREKYVPMGGPDGGDGGDGGNVILLVDERLSSLSHLKDRGYYRAGNGQPGRRARQTGKRGNDLILKVPPGTQVFSIKEKGERLIADLDKVQRWILLRGGRGGRGNVHFKSAVVQAPDYAEKGRPGQSMVVRLSLKLIADVGLVGLPNAGKSSLLQALTQAKVEVADYWFTTLVPNLAVIENPLGERRTIADIPGIIAGASQGHGLGLSFLKHIERVKTIVFVLDAGQKIAIADQFDLLCQELAAYKHALLDKPRLIVLSKADLYDQDERNMIESEIPRGCEDRLWVSAHTGEGLSILKDKFFETIATEGSRCADD